MRIIPLSLLTIILASLQHAWLAAPGAPDLTLALLAAVWLAGVAQRAAVRAWIVGTLTDCADPGSLVFHALGYTALGMAYPWLERFCHRGALGRGLLAAGMVPCIAVFDGAVTNGIGPSWLAVLTSAWWTGWTAALLGWMIDGVPEGLRPVARRERRPLTRLSLTL